MKIKVLDENNEPVTGAKVTYPSIESSTFTDFEGESEIASAIETTITVEYIGYEPQEVSLPLQGEELVIVLRKRVPSQAL